jgi:hypothetical protein
MDHHVGRLVTLQRKQSSHRDTVFVLSIHNGAEGSDYADTCAGSKPRVHMRHETKPLGAKGPTACRTRLGHASVSP